ncbi:mitogen-activated protein kinase kinase kinase 1-like protein [Tanacetum coccineum]
MKLYSRTKHHQVRPKLDRRNAIKNIDYDASTSSTSFESGSASNHRTRSLDIPPVYDNRTSFRIEGTEGEFDVICRRLGLSGPEDFAISTVDWENRRSYSPTGGGRGSLPASIKDYDGQLSVDFQRKVGLTDDDEEDMYPNDDDVSGIDEYLDGNECLVDKSDDEVKDGEMNENIVGNGARNLEEGCVVDETKINNGATVLEDGGDVESDKTGERGIKGVRPSLLLAPPPSMSLVHVDDSGSNWDLIRSFAPMENEDLTSERRDEGTSSSNEKVIVEASEIITSRVDTVGDEEEASSSVITAELQYTISPNGTFRGSFKNWQKGDFLGSGSFGTVYEGFDESGFFFAVKEVSLLDQGSQGKQSIFQLEQEISLLSQFHHENIVRYLGTDTDDGKLYIFLELVTKGSLAKLYQKYDLRDSQVSAYTRQILSGLNYLHERKVVHRDIKCANILVDASGSVKLADFGLAKATALNDIKSCKGTPYWMAPEVVNNRAKKGYGLAADIWSLGCTVLEMLTRKIPYYHLEGMQALFRIGRGEPPEIPNTLSAEAQDFIFKCLQVNPNDRPTAAQLLEHPFLKRPTSMNSALPSPHHNSPQL